MMQHHDFALSVKSLSAAGQFEGLAAVYGNLDAGGDIIEPGAFTETLQKRGDAIPVLWAHDLRNPIALGKLTDSPEGLHIRGELALDTASGAETYARMKRKIVGGLSIGYRIPDGGAVIEKGTRLLRKLDLFEVSLCTIPMNEKARVLAVKSAIQSVRDFETALREMGYSKSEACRIALHGFKGLGMSEPEDPIEGQLLDWLHTQRAKDCGLIVASAAF